MTTDFSNIVPLTALYLFYFIRFRGSFIYYDETQHKKAPIDFVYVHYEKKRTIFI